MVCIPCIVVPFVLWFFHKYIRPVLIKVWNPFGILGKEEQTETKSQPPDEKQKGPVEQNGVNKVHENGVSNGAVKVGGSNKKDD